MNEKAFEKVERDLNLATGEVKITEDLIKLDSFRITSESEIQPKEYTMEFLGRPCFPRKDLSVFAGVAKTGKTFVTSMLMAAATTSEEDPNVLALRDDQGDHGEAHREDGGRHLPRHPVLRVQRTCHDFRGTK